MSSPQMDHFILIVKGKKGRERRSEREREKKRKANIKRKKEEVILLNINCLLVVIY